MKTRIFLSVLGLVCLLSSVDGACDLSKKQADVDFPDIMQAVAESYIMGVEYSIPGAAQTDYYTEHYDATFKKGRIESHINGDNRVYIYRSETWEAWTIKNKGCTLQNITVIPDFSKDAQTDWQHFTGSENPTTVGPSAMFKNALDAWKKRTIKAMAYMGASKVRGEEAVYWRRCIRNGYADYFFASSEEENPFDSSSLKKITPLRIAFNGISYSKELSVQVYDIISFQHFIPQGVEPFQLPKGMNCQRGKLVDGPEMPDFSDTSVLLSAEAVYQKFNKEGELMSSYYSTLTVAIDIATNHLAYYYSAWNTTKTNPQTQEPFINAPEYVIYDMAHKYAYKINHETENCEISRVKNFVPQYTLPEKGGNLDLTDPYVLLPNSEFSYLSEGTDDRGVAVNIFEAEIKNFLIDMNTVIPRAIVSHSYLKSNEEVENTVSVRNAPTQIQLHFFRKPDDVEDILTLNIFGFTTSIPKRENLFDVSRCLTNDYLFLTIGFKIENQYFSEIEKALPEIEDNVVQQIVMKSELNQARIPTVTTDFKDNYVNVTMAVLGKPPLQLDFTYSEKNKKIKVSSESDTEGRTNFDTCASKCLEERSDCWGFSLCGETCYYGSSKNTQSEPDYKCTLYRRFSNETYLQSKETQANEIVSLVKRGGFLVMAVLNDQKRVTLTATSVGIIDPVNEDSMFNGEVDFPDISKNVADSYIMGVEYSVPGSAQTDYYTEYYELSFKRGRVESHINGENKVYIYRSETWEAWTIKGKECTLQNITDIPDFFKDAQTDWQHLADSENVTTVGPSAMFKNALDAWKKRTNKNMEYKGTSKTPIRGEKAVYWRRNMPSGGYADYFFAASVVENAFDSDSFKKVTPLRVVFNGVSSSKELSVQIYDIISFQHFIPKGVEPFQLPKGRNCQRGKLVDGPVLPDFSKNSLVLSAEVVYQKFNKDNELMSSYYSTLTLALDVEVQHLAYYYSAWNTTKPDPETKEPFVDAPEYVIYDMKHMYAYKINYKTGKCEVAREKTFVPQYKLPENGGNLDLTDPSILFPNSSLSFISEGTDRGLAVNIFETELKDYKLDKDTSIPRAIISHSYLKFNEEIENAAAVKNAPTQIQLHFFRKPDVEEVLTLNIFGFSTTIPSRRYLFDVTRCFKNDDDYLFLTIGFEIENQYLSEIEKALFEIEDNVVQQITMKSDLNPVRIPAIMTDFKDGYVYVSMIILGKPTLHLDFTDSEKGKKIKVSGTDDTQGVTNFDTCANNCLEERSDCWGFSLCGATCYYGSQNNTQIEVDDKCTLYRRFSNETYILSKESQANSVVAQVEAGEFMVMAVLGDEKRVTLTATIAEITNPADDDSMFENIGNLLNERMRVLKAATKLKKIPNIKNLGKLRYDECQSLCLDFKNCETLSYCLKNSECMISDKYDTDLKADDMEPNDLCILLARQYSDNFDRTPGVFVESQVGTKKNFDKLEDCARACLKEGSFKCLSFDHCARGEQKGCTLYTVHYLNPKDRKTSVTGKSPSCGHYTRKYSTEFKRKDETRVVGSKVASITNLNLEECAKKCIEYGDGTCFGYDFCQDKTLHATTCTLIDSDPSRLKSSYSSVCTNYVRSEPEFAPHPYTTGYAGGIGFLCFVVGGVIGLIVVFGVKYIRERRGN